MTESGQQTFFEDFPRLKALCAISLFNLHISRGLKFAIFAHNLLNTECYFGDPDVAPLDSIFRGVS